MYKIGEFSKMVNVPVKTLRYYDEISLLKPTVVDIYSNYRYYTDEQIKKLKIIFELKDAGFSLLEIKNNWNNWSDLIMLQHKQKVYLEQKELNKKIKKIDEIRLRIKDGKIYNEKLDIIKIKERRLKWYQKIQI